MEIGLKRLQIIKEGLRLVMMYQVLIKQGLDTNGQYADKDFQIKCLRSHLEEMSLLEATSEDVTSLYEDIEARIQMVVDAENLK